MNQSYDRGLARIGIIVPVSNSNLEPDMTRMRPEGVSVHFARAGGYDLDSVPDTEQMIKFAETSLDPVLSSLCAVRPDVVIYGCTSATLAKGPEYDLSFCKKMEQFSGVPSVTAAGSIGIALRALGVSSIGFTSPYTERLNRAGSRFLEQAGFSVLKSFYVGSDLGNYGQGDLSPEDVYQLGLNADHPDVQAVVLSCTDMRAVEIIDELEDELGKPVVCSNQALMYAASVLIGLPARVPGMLGKNDPA